MTNDCKKMKRALIVTALARFTKSFLTNDIITLQKMGYEVHCAANINHAGAECMPAYFEDMNVVFHQIDFSSSKPVSFETLKSYKQMVELFKKEHFDLIHCHTPIAGAIARFAGRRQRKAGSIVIYTTHGFYFHKHSSKKTYGTYNRQIEKTIHQQLTCNGMPLDPTYTGKAFWGMQDYLNRKCITGKKVLFIHTGGTPLFFDYMNGIQLREVSDNNAVEEAVERLEMMLVPSLSERDVNLAQYAEKLCIHGRVWCHYDMGKPVSIIAGYFNDMTSQTAYLSMLAVAKEYQGKKLASSLLSEFEDYAIQKGMAYVKLEVRKHNTAAQNLYRKFGYEIIDEASETSLYMKKKLKNIGGGQELYKFLKKVERLFPVPLSEREQLIMLASKFEKYGTVSYVRENGKIIAICAGYTNDQVQRLGYISVVASLPEYTNKGYGKVAVQGFIEKAKNAGMKAIHLYADKENKAALNMYGKLGFVDWIIPDERRPEDKHLIRWIL